MTYGRLLYFGIAAAVVALLLVYPAVQLLHVIHVFQGLSAQR